LNQEICEFGLEKGFFRNLKYLYFDYLCKFCGFLWITYTFLSILNFSFLLCYTFFASFHAFSFWILVHLIIFLSRCDALFSLLSPKETISFLLTSYFLFFYLLFLFHYPVSFLNLIFSIIFSTKVNFSLQQSNFSYYSPFSFSRLLRTF